MTSRTPGWDLIADVVIVGAGGAGLPAAIRAAEAGAPSFASRRITTWAATRSSAVDESQSVADTRSRLRTE